jgi:hypothetical protein
MPRAFGESVVEEAALGWLEAVGWRVVHGPDIAPDTPGAERGDYGEVVLARRLRDTLARLNPALPADALTPRGSWPKPSSLLPKNAPSSRSSCFLRLGEVILEVPARSSEHSDSAG